MRRKLTPPPEPRLETLFEAHDDVPAVEVLFAPIGPKARQAAGTVSSEIRNAASDEVREELKAAFDDRGRMLAPLSDAAAEVLLAMSRAASDELIRHGILEWKGLGGPGDEDEPIEVSPETITWFLADEDLRAAADRVYVLPDALRLAEKNASGGLPNGTSTEVTPAAATATPPATSKRKAAAKSAPIASTSRKPTKRKSSGT